MFWSSLICQNWNQNFYHRIFWDQFKRWGFGSLITLCLLLTEGWLPNLSAARQCLLGLLVSTSEPLQSLASSHPHQPLHSNQRDVLGLSIPSGTMLSLPVPKAPVHQRDLRVSAGRLCFCPAACRLPQHLPWGLAVFPSTPSISTAPPCHFFSRCNLSSKLTESSAIHVCFFWHGLGRRNSYNFFHLKIQLKHCLAAACSHVLCPTARGSLSHWSPAHICLRPVNLLPHLERTSLSFCKRSESQSILLSSWVKRRRKMCIGLSWGHSGCTIAVLHRSGSKDLALLSSDMGIGTGKVARSAYLWSECSILCHHSHRGGMDEEALCSQMNASRRRNSLERILPVLLKWHPYSS